ncbi:helix-turn-helix domain-containing protein, partial [Rhizobium laguerreae]|uniref:helix-turn-helix domain-containing protein n=1 Tax=Rhizobium laguerreae TaxID=1076926 RepID=UPI00144176D2
MATITERLHTFEEAAAILNISVKTLRGHVNLGRIRSVVIGGGKNRKHRRFTDKNIASFIAAQKVREIPACPSTSPKTPLITMPVNQHRTLTPFAYPILTPLCCRSALGLPGAGR